MEGYIRPIKNKIKILPTDPYFTEKPMGNERFIFWCIRRNNFMV